MAADKRTKGQILEANKQLGADNQKLVKDLDKALDRVKELEKAKALTVEVKDISEVPPMESVIAALTSWRISAKQGELYGKVKAIDALVNTVRSVDRMNN